MNTSDLLVLLLSSVPVVMAGALFWRTVTDSNRDDVLPDEKLLAAITQHSPSSNGGSQDWTLSH